MHDCMTQEDAMNMDNKQAAQILIPLRDMMIDQHGCPISDAWFALDKAIDALSTQPNGDLISRQAAAEVIYKALKIPAPDYRKDPFHDSMGLAIAMADQIPSAQQWIPCSERLPEEYDEYFVTWTCKESHKRYIGILEYEISEEYDHEKKQFKGEWLFDDYMTACTDVNVIAWQPLPEPYQQI